MNYIEYDVKERIGYITLNRPDKRNALNSEVVTELQEIFRSAEDDTAVKVIVLKANGESFCAGADLAYLQKLQNFSFEDNLADSHHLKELFHQVYTLKKVVIAQVQGHALAGGCGLVSVCDFAFSVPGARFGYSEVKIGFIPAIVMVFLLRKIGEMRAKSLLLTGDPVTAAEALSIGLINQIFPADSLEVEVNRFAGSLVNGNAADAMMLTKRMIAEVQSLPLAEALDYAAKMNATARGTADCKKGIEAFLKKEKLSW